MCNIALVKLYMLNHAFEILRTQTKNASQCRDRYCNNEFAWMNF